MSRTTIHHMQSPSLSAIQPNNTTTTQGNNEDSEEKQKLEKQNFEQKMKIFHLEEQLKQQQEQGSTKDTFHNRTKSELSDLKLQLEEKEIELEQRNLLLLKAKNAIETLKSEIDRLKSTDIQQHQLEEQLNKLKQMNDNVEQEYRVQLQLLQNELTKTKESLTLKTKENSILDDQIVRYLSLSVCYIHSHTPMYY